MFQKKVTNIIKISICFILLIAIVSTASIPPTDKIENIRKYTRTIEFDYIGWTIDAVINKLEQAALDIPRFLSDDKQIVIVKNNMELTREIQTSQAVIETIYADPNIDDPDEFSKGEKKNLNNLQNAQSFFGPLSETILQQQASTILRSMGLSFGGQPLPPLFYHITPLPYALIVSPRDTIRQDANISLLPDMSLEERVALEQEVEKKLDVSALVVPVGGVGVYPTMVLSTSNLTSLTEIIAHEWTHNYLTLRPLGMNYFTSNILRTINETTASISGKEIGLFILKKYYPEFVPPPETPAPVATYQTHPDELGLPLIFDFRAEMRETRVKVDELLADGKIIEAESFMEERRQFMWENGYQIRRLNQAYFAFHGAYADTPGGAAGDDPVGAAVRMLRDKSDSLSSFLNKISWISSYEKLLSVLSEMP